MQLGERLLKADVQVIGVRLVEAAVVNIQQRQRAHVDAVVVVGELQPREHAAYQQALARPGIANDADEPVKCGQVPLGNSHAQLAHAHIAARGKVHAVQGLELHLGGWHTQRATPMPARRSARMRFISL